MTALKWGTEQLVNTTTTANQQAPQVTALLDGGYVVAWDDFSATGDDTSSFAVRMQRYDAFGDKVGGETLVNRTTASSQFESTITTLADGSFVVCWRDDSTASSDIRFRHFNADGSPIDLSDVVAIGGVDTQTTPSVVALPGGGFVISYQEIQSGSFDIFAQRFDDTGVAVGGPITVSSPSSDGEVDSAVAAFANDSFVVTWVNFTTGQILFQRVNADGTPNGAAIVVNNTVGTVANEPDVVVLENGGFLVVWQDIGQPFPDTGSLVVRAQLYDASGTEVGGEFTVNSLADNNQRSPSLVALPGGGFVAVYDSNGDIRGQVFDGLGARVGAEFLVNTGTTGTQTLPTVDVLSDGRLIVTWVDDSALGDDTSGFAVRMQIIDPRDGSITGTAVADTLLGHDLVNDELNGLAGNDTLNGLAGADFMYGGDNDDTYVVDNAGDRAIESVGHGTDLVQSSVSFTLGVNVENLALTGAAAINGTGNALANTITGNAAANVLNGLGGADTMLGLVGNDSYTVDNALDTVSEAGGAGIDTVLSSISFSLVASAHVIGAVERLTLTGALAINGTGNNAANILTGNNAANILTGGIGADILRGLNGNDTLIGGAGIDTLTGGLNNDSFVFNAPLSAANRDIVTDFNHVADTFRLENAVMAALGGPGLLNPAFFRAGAAAADANDHVIYNQATGGLFFDSNGIAAGGITLLATLTNRPVLAANDFVVI